MLISDWSSDVCSSDLPVPAVYAVFANDMHAVRFAAHRVGRNIVRDDPVTSLARELRLRMGNEVVRLGGKADQQRRALGTRGQPCEAIGRASCRARVGQYV